eukprot:2000376-Amphidinium_carterae.1
MALYSLSPDDRATLPGGRPSEAVVGLVAEHLRCQWTGGGAPPQRLHGVIPLQLSPAEYINTRQRCLM